MKYYKTGENEKMANLSLRTIRYYDQIGLLKPSQIADNGYRLYTNRDFVKLQKIISLKNLGFSLDDIFSLTINDNQLSLKASLDLQKRMIDRRIESLLEMKEAILKTEEYLENYQDVDWQQILNQINVSTMENRLVEQYKNANNIDIRIRLHEKYSTNPKTWFKWLFDHYDLKAKSKVLELGCGNGQLWVKNKGKFNHIDLIVSDVSEGMLKDAKEQLKEFSNIHYCLEDVNELSFENETFDMIIANHLLFYLKDVDKGLEEIKRVLKKGGIFYCSTYGNDHMKEMTDLIKEFNPAINLSMTPLYDVFGLDNGKSILEGKFDQVTQINYEDYLLVSDKQDLIDYILSCHGNQSSYIVKDYDRFEKIVEKKMSPTFKITKDAGMFICVKK